MSFDHMRQVLDVAGLPPLPRLVLLVLADAMSKDGKCFPGVLRIMRRSGASRDAVCRALRRLERDGWIVVERHHGRSNRYRLTLANQSARRTSDQSARRTTSAPKPTSPPDGLHQSGRRTTPVRQTDPILSGNLQGTTDSTEEEDSVRVEGGRR